MRGFQTTLTLQRPVSCESCSGSGSRPGRAPRTCPECRGTGRKSLAQGPIQIRQTCPRCTGTGRLPGDPCTVCGGTGLVVRPDTIKVNIPPGAAPGRRIRVRGKGEGGMRGHLPGTSTSCHGSDPIPFLRGRGGISLWTCR
ncbi:MAG: hypothetical protein HYY46_18530 [Deltaproteobacteria bacterium]|nr:hypothetical protein [Deltaproteobacteria bacterium]